MAAIEEDGEDQGPAIRTGRIAVRRAISVPLTPVTSGLSRSLADTPPRRSGHVTGPDGTASQADSPKLSAQSWPHGTYVGCGVAVDRGRKRHRRWQTRDR